MKLIIKLITLIGIILTIGCSEKQDYHSVVSRELASGIRNDSLFLDNFFGMTSEAFYKGSWDLNKKGLIMEGGNNASVLYKLPERSDITFEYYPIIKDQKVQSMTGTFRHIAWAPWNKETWADVIIEDVVDILEGWYGAGFIEVPSPGIGKAYAKVDGNRRIAVYYTVDENVQVLFTDLTNDDGLITIDKR